MYFTTSRRPPRCTRNDTLLPYTALVRSDGDAATAERLLPVNEGEPSDAGLGGDTVAEHRQAGTEHAGDVAHHAVGHQRGDILLLHAGAEDVAEDAGVFHAHGIDHGDAAVGHRLDGAAGRFRSEEHTSELQSLMRNSYAVFCLKKKTKPTNL